MAVDPVIQTRFERNLRWKRSWPSCFLGLLASLEILLGFVIFFTELFNIVMDFWHTNIFGGIWASIILLINWILIYTTICCTTTTGASTCALLWNIITLVALGVLIAFDIIFILNPYACVLTPSCASQPQVISLNFIMQLIPPFKNYSTYDSKKFFLQIQVGCAGAAFLISLIYILIYIVCKCRKGGRVAQQTPAPAAPLLSQPQQQLPIMPSAPVHWPTDTKPEFH